MFEYVEHITHQWNWSRFAQTAVYGILIQCNVMHAAEAIVSLPFAVVIRSRCRLSPAVQWCVCEKKLCIIISHAYHRHSHTHMQTNGAYKSVWLSANDLLCWFDRRWQCFGAMLVSTQYAVDIVHNIHNNVSWTHLGRYYEHLMIPNSRDSAVRRGISLRRSRVQILSKIEWKSFTKTKWPKS